MTAGERGVSTSQRYKRERPQEVNEEGNPTKGDGGPRGIMACCRIGNRKGTSSNKGRTDQRLEECVSFFHSFVKELRVAGTRQ